MTCYITTTQTTKRDGGRRRKRRGQKAQDHRDKEKAREVRRKRMVEKRKREGRVWVLIETRTKASGRRAKTAGETEK